MEILRMEKWAELMKEKSFYCQQAVDGYETRESPEENEVAMTPSQRLWEPYKLTSKKQFIFETNEPDFESNEERLFLTPR